MHPFFRSTIGNTSPQGSGSYCRKDSSSRNKSPSGSYEEEEEECEEACSSRRAKVPSTSPNRCTSPKESASTRTMAQQAVPIIKVEDESALGKRKDRKASSENRTRLGPNKNNIIMETLQKELKGNQ